MRHAARLVLLSLVVGFITGTPALVAGQVNVYSHQLSSTGETVLVTYSPNVNYGSCPSAGLMCADVSATIQVTPCPPDVPCVGGSYTFTMGAPWTEKAVTLALGTSYSFSGQWKRDFSYVYPCVYSCFSTGSLAPANFHTQEAAPYWEVTPVYANEDTVIVSAVLKNCATTCYLAKCLDEYFTLEVRPCVLDIDGIGPACVSGVRSEYRGRTHRVTLLQNKAYVFDGLAVFYGRSREMTGGCAQEVCSWFGDVVPVEFTGTTTATEATTWGKVKATYRSP